MQERLLYNNVDNLQDSLTGTVSDRTLAHLLFIAEASGVCDEIRNLLSSAFFKSAVTNVYRVSIVKPGIATGVVPVGVGIEVAVEVGIVEVGVVEVGVVEVVAEVRVEVAIEIGVGVEVVAEVGVGATGTAPIVVAPAVKAIVKVVEVAEVVVEVAERVVQRVAGAIPVVATVAPVRAARSTSPVVSAASTAPVLATTPVIEPLIGVGRHSG
ncbi:unnamed protein product [Toxocara canis]|uniref:Uncharacterized protein n=1 Tax=Toxocara canis TaxID=6265 RepID=A0A183UWL5_TOXCA|nr:unnamed protein product [Toxocara canis]